MLLLHLCISIASLCITGKLNYDAGLFLQKNLLVSFFQYHQYKGEGTYFLHNTKLHHISVVSCAAIVKVELIIIARILLQLIITTCVRLGKIASMDFDTLKSKRKNFAIGLLIGQLSDVELMTGV